MPPSIHEAQQELTHRVMALPGVVGVALGDCAGTPCIRVLVAERTSELAARIPASFQGHRVVIAEIGEPRAPRPPPGPPTPSRTP